MFLPFLKGPRGTTIEVEIDRSVGGHKTFKVTREEIKLPDLPYSGMLSNKYWLCEAVKFFSNSI